MLARIGQIFLSYDLTVQGARITTLGERVEDNFLVVTHEGHAITDNQFSVALQQTLIDKLSEKPAK